MEVFDVIQITLKYPKSLVDLRGSISSPLVATQELKFTEYFQNFLTGGISKSQEVDLDSESAKLRESE